MRMSDLQVKVAHKLTATWMCNEIYQENVEAVPHLQRLARREMERSRATWAQEEAERKRTLPGLDLTHVRALMRRRGFTHVKVYSGDSVPIEAWYPYGQENNIWQSWRGQVYPGRDDWIADRLDPRFLRPDDVVGVWEFVARQEGTING